MLRKFFAARSLPAAMVLLLGSSAWAGTAPGGSVDYGPLPGATSVPTLGEWTLVLLALLLAVVAYRALRGRVNGRLLSNLILAGGAATVVGHGAIQEAEALVLNEVNMSAPGGGTVSGTYVMQLTNTSGVPLQIKAIRPNEGVSIVAPPEENLPECTVNAVIAPSAKCSVYFNYPETLG